MNARIIPFILIGCIVFLMPQVASAHCKEWNELYAEVMSLYREGQNEEAITAARRAVSVAENRFGVDHPYVAISVTILAQLYFETGQYGEAEPLYKRALGIYETSMGPESLGAAQTLTNLSGLYLKMDRNEEAFDCLARAQTIYRILCKTRPLELTQ